MKRRFAVVFGGLLGFGVVVACSSSDDKATAQDYTGSCSVLASRCHPFDGKTQLAHDCHELGHAGNDSACGPRRAECEAECPPTDAALPFQVVDGEVVSTKDSGSNDTDAEAGIDAGPDICIPYCDCLKTACGMQEHYPYTSTDQCIATCHTFSKDAKECWPQFCEKAKTLSEANKGHTCDHAIGIEELDECPYGQ